MAAPAVKNPGTFVYATYGDAKSLDPAVQYDTASNTVLKQIYEGLLDYDKTDVSKFIPVLATELPTVENGGVSKDGMTWRFHIRQGVTFQNGDPLTAEDVAYTFKRDMVIDPDGGPDWIWYTVFLDKGGSRDGNGNITVTWPEINGIATVEGNDVVFHLKKPFAPFLSVIAQTWGAIVDKKFVVAHGGWDGTEATWKQYNNPAAGKETLYDIANGTGPYKLTRWDKGNEIVWDRWDGYWGKKPALKEGIYKIVNEWSTRKLMLLNGDADTVQVDPQYYAEMDKETGITAHKNLPTLVIGSVFFNYDIKGQDNPYIGSGKLDGNGVTSNFFSDKNVRKAIEYAWDEKTFLQDALAGHAIDPVTPFPKGLPYKDESLQRPAFDLNTAADYFKKAWGGQVWQNGFKLPLFYNTGNSTREVGMKMLAENLQKINPKFQVQVIGLPWPQLLNAMNKGQLTVYMVGWAPDYPDPDDYAAPFMASFGTYPASASYKNPEVDQLVKAAVATTDPATRKADYYKLQQIYMEDVPSLSVYQSTLNWYYKDWVKGFYYNVMFALQSDMMKSLSK
jgi:peptide/nickel transport system substrate-binding protein